MNSNVSKNSTVFLAVVLVAGTISTMIPTTTFAQSYDGPYAKDQKSSKVNIQKVNCNNIIINGIDSAGQDAGSMINGMTADEEDRMGQWIGNGDKKESNSIDKNIVNFCENKHKSVVLEPEPTTGSLTVKKQIFGCNIIDDGEMNCEELDNNSQVWLSCDDTPIDTTPFCLSLPEEIFDIEVLDDQNNLLQEFKGSQQGTTLPNLQSGTYNVNEIRHQTNIDQLGEDETIQQDCVSRAGFDGGGALVNDTNPLVGYGICFEYEDEQGNDCTTNIIAAGEEKTCIVKNYIRNAFTPNIR